MSIKSCNHFQLKLFSHLKMFLFEAFSWFMTSQSHNWESCYSCFLAQLSHFIQVCLKMSHLFEPNVTDIFGEVKYFDNFISFWHIPLRNIFFSFWRLSPEVPLLRCCRGVRTICYLGEPNFSLHWQLLILCSNEKLLFYKTMKPWNVALCNDTKCCRKEHGKVFRDWTMFERALTECYAEWHLIYP